jgi:5-methylthioadenosine/S-adenosylhomocysteine deaminase
VRVDGPHVEPGGDVFSRLVYACGARDVRHVFVDGRHVVRDGEHRLLDRDAVLARARAQAKKLVARAKL